MEQASPLQQFAPGFRVPSSRPGWHWISGLPSPPYSRAHGWESCNRLLSSSHPGQKEISTLALPPPVSDAAILFSPHLVGFMSTHFVIAKAEPVAWTAMGWYVVSAMFMRKGLANCVWCCADQKALTNYFLIFMFRCVSNFYLLFSFLFFSLHIFSLFSALFWGLLDISTHW